MNLVIKILIGTAVFLIALLVAFVIVIWITSIVVGIFHFFKNDKIDKKKNNKFSIKQGREVK